MFFIPQTPSFTRFDHCDIHRHCCRPEGLVLVLCVDRRPVEKIVQLHRGSGCRDKGYLGSRSPATTAICICSESKHRDVEMQDGMEWDGMVWDGMACTGGAYPLHLIIACDLMHVKQVNTQVQQLLQL